MAPTEYTYSSATSLLVLSPDLNAKNPPSNLRRVRSWPSTISAPTDPAHPVPKNRHSLTLPTLARIPGATAQKSISPTPPYAGPPPLPAGTGIPQAQWQAGFWQFNPAYKSRTGVNAQQQSHVSWIPSQQWTAYHQQSQQYSFNPYKRVPRPPSAEYLTTKLIDNPLGLMNISLIPIEEHYPQGQRRAEFDAQALWIWRPSTQDSEPPSAQPGGVNIHRAPLLKPTFSPTIIRTPEHYRLSSAAPSSSSSSFKAARHRSERVGTPATPPNGSRATSSSPHAHLTNISPGPPARTLSPSFSPNTPPPRMRYGYWNRRGDHLTPDGYIVYAPEERAYPTELATYPPEEDGYRNHEGTWRRWAERPELPESLPKRGRAPEKPYANFVIYVNRDPMGSLGLHRTRSRRSSTDSFRSGLLVPLEEEEYRNDEGTRGQLAEISERRGSLPEVPYDSFMMNSNRDQMALHRSRLKRSSIESLRSGLLPRRITKRHSYHNFLTTPSLSESNSAISKHQDRCSVERPLSTKGLMSNTETRQKPKDEAGSSSSRSLPLRVDPWDLDQRLAAISTRRPTSPTSSSSSYGSAHSTRSRASSWSNSSGRRIPGTNRDVMEFPFGYPTPD